jgi:hypothetical protein
LKAWWCWVAVAVLGFSSGCGGGRQASGDAQDPNSASGSAASGGTPWSQKTRDQKLEWMGLEVLPKMKALFVEYNGESFADFKCQTCHGNDMEVVDFKMPNSLFALSGTDPVGSGKAYDEKLTEFMLTRVTPTMAKLLDMDMYNPETKQGFGCLNCHQSE